jgi:hypothetical protein
MFRQVEHESEDDNGNQRQQKVEKNLGFLG